MQDSSVQPGITIKINIWFGCMFLERNKKLVSSQPVKFLIEGC